MQNGMTPVDEIIVDRGLNPRTIIEQDELKELVFSIKTFGVLNPLIVRADDEGKLHLVEGHRRLKAAKAAKLTHVPTHTFVAGEGTNDHETAALVTNIVRANLHPVDEGRALRRMRETHDGLDTNTALAKAAGLTAERVARNIRYAYLPTKVGDRFLMGQLGARALPIIEQLVGLSPQVTDDILKAVFLDEPFSDKTFSIRASMLLDSPGSAVETMLKHYADPKALVPKPDLVPLPLGDVELALRFCGERGDRQQQRLYEFFPLKKQGDWSTRQVPRMETPEMVDAARAFGCLTEIGYTEEHHYRPVMKAFVDSEEWFCDQVEQYLLRLHRDRKAKKEEQAEARLAKLPADEKTAPNDKVRAAIRKRKREAELDRRRQRELTNFQLGQNLQEKMSRRKLTTNDAKILATLVLEADSALWKSWGLTTPNPLPLPEGYDEKDPYARNPAREALEAWVLRPRSADEVMGRLFQVLIASRFVDHSTVAESKMGSNGTRMRDELAATANGILPAITRAAFEHATANRQPHSYDGKQTAKERTEYERELQKAEEKAEKAKATRKRRAKMTPREVLTDVVSGSIERGEAEPITAIEEPPAPEQIEGLSEASDEAELAVSAD